MSKVFRGFVCTIAVLGFVSATGRAACQPPAAIPPPEPEFAEQVQSNATEASAEVFLTLNSAPSAIQDASETVEPALSTEPAPTLSPLPDIVRCCPINQITLSTAIAGVSRNGEPLPVPRNDARDYLASHGASYAPHIMGAPSLRHPTMVFFQPLYFEDPNLERCGAGHGIATELVSAVRFFGRAPLIPYMVGSQNPHQCVPSLGDCPVCSCYGKSDYLAPWNARGLAFEAAAVAGLVFLFP